MKTEIAVIGGGASGLMAALTAAHMQKAMGRTASVLLLEGNNRVGKKLLATGNGRCNLTNMHISPANFHGDQQEIAKILENCPPERVLAAFQSVGLLCRSDGEGRVYPYNLQAAAVLGALRKACENCGVVILCEMPVEHLLQKSGGFGIAVQNKAEFFAKRIILACGGKASPKHGCGQNGYGLAEAMGHSVTACAPALVQVRCRERMIPALKGVRCKAGITLLRGGKSCYAESGEVLFSEQGLSGICIFNASSYLAGCENPENHQIVLDFAEEMAHEEILHYLKTLQQQAPQLPCRDMLAGFLNIRLGEEIIKTLSWDKDLTLRALRPGQMALLAERIKALPFHVTGLAGWENAQITAGGVPLTEVEVSAMESKKCPGLYLAGEMLNANGQCGGYNLHFAWATGMAAGMHAAKL